MGCLRSRWPESPIIRTWTAHPQHSGHFTSGMGSGFAAFKTVTAMHEGKILPNAQHVQQRDPHAPSTVGDTGQLQAGGMQLTPAFFHTGTQMTGTSVDAAVVLLVAGVCAFIQGVIDGTVAAQSLECSRVWQPDGANPCQSCAR